LASEYADRAVGDEQDSHDRDALGTAGEPGGQRPQAAASESAGPAGGGGAAVSAGAAAPGSPAGSGGPGPAEDVGAGGRGDYTAAGGLAVAGDRAAGPSGDPGGKPVVPGQRSSSLLPSGDPGGKPVVPGQRSSSLLPSGDPAPLSVGGRGLSGQQPPFSSHNSLDPPEAITPDSGPASPATVADQAGPAGPGHRPGQDRLAGSRPPAAYGTEAGYASGPYASERYSAEPYGAGAHGPASDYGTSDSYGQPGGYGPGEGYGPAAGYLPPDPYLSGQSYFPPDPYGPPDPYDRPTAAGPAVSRGSHAATAAPGPASAPPAATARPDHGPLSSADPLTPRPGDAVPAAHGGRGAPAGYGPRDGGLADGHDTLSRPQEPAESTDSLTPEFLLPGRRRAPAPGWRRILYQATAGLLRVPESAAELRRRDMINRIRTPVAGGHHRVAVLSLKGGVGKTTTTVGLGATLASLRGDRVIAVDANPDRGTLSDKVRLETAATVRDLLNERGQIERYADVRAFTSQAPSRLEVLASDRDPTVSVAFSEEDYCEVSRVLEHFYSICLTDCGTGLLHSAMAGVLRLADQIVLVSSPSVDGARSASATLDWLAAHAYGDLVRGAVVVLSIVRPSSRNMVDLDRLEQHFAARCRAVTRIPYDPHLEEGAEVELDQLSRAAADAYLGLAAIVGDGLAWPRNAAHPAMAQNAARRGTVGTA
jgi:MinD-like ATPase involved in chromosome partitioning or flagellar assembly